MPTSTMTLPTARPAAALPARCWRCGAPAAAPIAAPAAAPGRRFAARVVGGGAAGGFAPAGATPLDVWRQWASDVRGMPIDSGHFLAEEAPDTTAAALGEFFAA